MYAFLCAVRITNNPTACTHTSPNRGDEGIQAKMDKLVEDLLVEGLLLKQILCQRASQP